jgi:hypothetical protein
MKSLSLISYVLLAIMMASSGKVSAFVPSAKPISVSVAPSTTTFLGQPAILITNRENLHNPVSKTQLLFGWDDDEENVKTTQIDVDAATLTAVGFGAIAFNFLVLANMGDMGIGGLVARIINTFG